MAEMKRVTLSLADRNSISRRIRAAAEGKNQGAHISFASADLLWSVLTRRRWEIIQAMAGKGGLSIRAVARAVDRDFKGVHSDVQILLNTGILDKQDDGKIAFPYDAVHVDFVLHAA